MGKIVILGVFVMDVTVRTDSLPVLGETRLGKGLMISPGGKGSNQAIAAARLGGQAIFLSRLGDDDFAAQANRIWREAGVSPVVHIDKARRTGAALILVDDASGDNAIVIAPEVSADMTAADADDFSEHIASADVFMTQLEQPLSAAKRGLQIAREAGVTTVLNPAPAYALPDSILRLCDFITPNQSETRAICGFDVTDDRTARMACDALKICGVGTPIITMGEAGVYVDGEGLIPALRAGRVVETTGAGDAFNAGLAVALSEGRPAGEAARFGNAAAAISVTRKGAALSMPRRADVERLLNR